MALPLATRWPRTSILASADDAKQSFGLGDAPVVFYSGHFDPADEIIDFCQAAAPVARRTGASLVFVGDGPDLPRVKEFFIHQPGIMAPLFSSLAL